MGETISTLVFRPPPPTQLRSSIYFWLETGDEDGNQIPAFYIQRPGAKVTLLFSHGNAEDLGMMYPRMKALAKILGVNIMAYEYSGYGISTGGPPSETMCYKNIDAAFRYLTKMRNIPPHQIILYGRSLGSGPSCYLAAKTAKQGRSVAGLILHSPFLSVYRVVVDCGFTLHGDMFKNIMHAPDIRCPVLIIHATKDEVVPFWHSQELLALLDPTCRVKPFFVEGLGHNNIEIYEKVKYTQKILYYLERYIPARRGILNEEKSPLLVPELEQANLGALMEKYDKSRLNPGILCQSVSIINDVISSSTAEECKQKTRKIKQQVMNQVQGRPKDNVKENESKLSNLPFLFPSPLNDCKENNSSNSKSSSALPSVKIKKEYTELQEPSFTYSTDSTEDTSSSSQGINVARKYYRTSY